jgi:hypothetical protein
MAFKFLSRMPGGQIVLDELRLRVGHLRGFDVSQRMYAVESALAMMRSTGRSVAGQKLVEIGAGWHPVLPALFFGLGAREIIMTDVYPHIRGGFALQSVSYLLGRASRVSELSGIPEETLRARWSGLLPRESDWRDVWLDNGISYLAPFDVGRTSWPDASIDLVYSNGCLGYVPQAQLNAIVPEIARLIGPTGWTMHDIDVSDEYADVDPTIDGLNFLSFSEGGWDRLGNSRLNHQNRLRPAEYIRLFERAGLTVVFSERKMQRLPDLGGFRARLAPEFRGLPEEELLCGRLLCVAQPAGTRGVTPDGTSSPGSPPGAPG